MPVEVGQQAPDFTLNDADKKTRSLSEFRGKNLVLAFFPGAFTSVCTREMCTFRDSLTQLAGLNAHVVAVSVDGPWAQKAFADANKLNFPLLCDYNREVLKRYGLEHHDFGGVKGYTASKRSVFVLDSRGTVRYRWVSEDPAKEPNYGEINQALSKI